jgi:hypothetical protein
VAFARSRASMIVMIWRVQTQKENEVHATCIDFYVATQVLGA